LDVTTRFLTVFIVALVWPHVEEKCHLPKIHPDKYTGRRPSRNESTTGAEGFERLVRVFTGLPPDSWSVLLELLERLINFNNSCEWPFNISIVIPSTYVCT
jgi:hypothetical protein